MSLIWWTKDTTYGKYDYPAASIDKKGTIKLSIPARKMMKEWGQVMLGYDSETERIYLKLCERGTKGSRAMSQGRINATTPLKFWGVSQLMRAEGAELKQEHSDTFYFELKKKPGRPRKENDE